MNRTNHTNRTPPRRGRPQLDVVRAAPTAALLAALSGTIGCASDGLARFSPRPIPMAVRAEMTLRPTDAAASSIVLPLKGRPATATLRHNVGVAGVAGASCFASLEVNSALADGSCALALAFAPRSDGPGMALTKASVVARAADGSTCAALQGRLPAGSDAVVYELDPTSASAAWLPLAPPADDETKAGVEPWAIAALPVFPRGEVTLRAGADALVLDLRSVQLGGDVVSTAAAAGACSPCAEGSACRSAYPSYRMRDFQPQSPTAELRVPMDVYLGTPTVVLLTQGW